MSDNNDNRTDWKLRENFGKWMGLFLALSAVILLYFAVVNLGVIAKGILGLLNILRPVIYGCVIAYLLNPIYKFYQRFLAKILGKDGKLSSKMEKLVGGLSIALAMLSGILIIVVLCWMVLPQLVETVVTLINNLPGQANMCYELLEKKIQNNKFLEKQVQQAFLEATEYVDTKLEKELIPWLRNELLPNINIFAAEFASGVFSVLNVLYNIFIGIIVAIYLLGSKRTFLAQAKKFIYGVFRKKHADVILRYIRISNEMFSGFISGKLVDSTIIGILCFLVMWILQLPYAMLISVVVGVTNIIPVFGPYIGAIPSVLLILLVNPWQALYFLIWIIILQQIDGNIIGPMILGESTGLSAFWVLFSILLFGGLWGIVGMLVGCPLFAVIYRITKDIISSRLESRELSADTKDYIDLKEIIGQGGNFAYNRYSEQELHAKKKRESAFLNEMSAKWKKAVSEIQSHQKGKDT